MQSDLLPHRLCEYLFHLAGKTAEFHRCVTEWQHLNDCITMIS